MSLQFCRYNGMWTRDVQDVVFAILMCGWLGGLGTKDTPAEAGKLFTMEEVGEILNGESTYYCSSMSSDSRMAGSTGMCIQSHWLAPKQDWDSHTLLLLERSLLTI